MNLIAALTLAASGLLGQAQADEPKKTADLHGLAGDYQITTGERDGKPIAADRLKDITIRIAANAITTFDKDNNEVYAATYQLDPSQTPWRITMTATITPMNAGKGETAQGLVQVAGDEVKLIYALPGGAAPKEFEAGEKQQMFILKRIGKTIP
jgi:uncharacterized protein (TIGR03067 family)